MEATAFWPDKNARQCFYYSLMDAHPDPLDEKTIKRIALVIMEYEGRNARERCRTIEHAVRRLSTSSEVSIDETFLFFFAFASIQRALTTNERTRKSWR